MHGTRQQFLAGARFSQHQQAEVVTRHPRRHFANGIQRAAGRPLDAVEIEDAARPRQIAGGTLAQHRSAAAQLKMQAVGVALKRLRLDRVAHLGQQMVTQNHTDFKALYLLACLVSVAGREYVEVFIERAAHGLLRTHFVVYHQHRWQGLGRLHGRCTARWRGVQAWGSLCTKW